MKKTITIIAGILAVILVGFLVFKNYYFSEKAIFQRKIKTWNEKVKNSEISKSGKIEFENEVSLRWTISTFIPEKHKFERCESIDANYLCKIDGKDWFGSDFKMNLPKNELKKLTIFIDGKYVNLNVSQMFNPNFSGELTKNQFKLQKTGNDYLLFGFFSDGAGTYTAKWKINNQKSVREILSTDEKDFEWQNE